MTPSTLESGAPTWRSVRPRAPWRLLGALLALLVSTTAAGQAAQQSATPEADLAFQEERWDDAAAGYAARVQEAPDDGNAWYQLAAAQHALGEHDEALHSLERAITLLDGAPRARLGQARKAAIMLDAGDRDGALTALEALADAGPFAPVYLVLVNATGPYDFTPLHDEPRFDAAVESLRPCGTEKHRQFDYWVGDWEVYGPNGGLVGTNRIDLQLDGCTLHENWVSATGLAGKSYSFYDAANDKWHQTWINAIGNPIYLDGSFNGEAIVLGDENNRVTWSRLPNGYVRQHWEVTGDGGATWTTAFDGEYRPKAEGETED